MLKDLPAAQLTINGCLSNESECVRPDWNLQWTGSHSTSGGDRQAGWMDRPSIQGLEKDLQVVPAPWSQNDKSGDDGKTFSEQRIFFMKFRH